MEIMLMLTIVLLSLREINNAKLSDTTSLFAGIRIDDFTSCAESCGLKNGVCYCDEKCEAFGDCCFDYWEQCSSSKVRDAPIQTALVELTELLNQTKSGYTTTIQIVDYNSATVNPVSILTYFDVFSVKVKSACQDVRCEMNNSRDTIESVYDKDQDVVYKNYYCAICNGVAEKNLVNMTYKKVCSSSVESLIQSPSELTLEFIANAGPTCSLVYVAPVNHVYHFEEDWRQCSATNEDAFHLNILSSLLNNASTPGDPLASSLCQIYNQPVEFTASNNTVESTLIFKNIHCIKCWFYNNGFDLGLNQIGSIAANDFVFSVTNNNLAIKISIAGSPVTSRKFSSCHLTDIENLYQMFRGLSNGFTPEILIKPEENSSLSFKSFFEIDQSNLKTTKSVIKSYLSSQLNSFLPMKYTFYLTLKFDFLLDFNILTLIYGNKLENDQERVEDFIKMAFFNQFMQRYNITQFLDATFNTSVYTNAPHVSLFIPLKFPITNIQLFNMNLLNLIDIVRDAYNQYFKMFELSDKSAIVEIKILNYHANETTENAQCNNVLNRADYQADLTGFMEEYKQLKIITISYKETGVSYIHRLNGMLSLEVFNIDSDYFRNRYFYSMKLTRSTTSIQMCYSVDPYLLVFTSYEKEKDYCDEDHVLYLFLDDIRLISIFKKNVTFYNSTLWSIDITYNNQQFGFSTDSKHVSRFGDYLDYRVFFCIASSDNTTLDNLRAFDQRISSLSYDVLFVQLTTDTARTLNAGKFIIFCFLLLQMFLRHLIP